MGKTSNQKNNEWEKCVFKLKPINKQGKFLESVNMKFGFQKSRTPKWSKVQKVQDNIIFNKDKNYATPSFILKLQQKHYTENFSLYKLDHDARMKDYTEQRTTMFVAKPKSRSKLCNVCKSAYVDYMQHIKSKAHKANIQRSYFNGYILDLVDFFQQTNSIDTQFNNNKCVRNSVIDHDEYYPNSSDYLQQENKILISSARIMKQKHRLAQQKQNYNNEIYKQTSKLQVDFPLNSQNDYFTTNKFPSNGSTNTIPLPPHLQNNNRKYNFDQFYVGLIDYLTRIHSIQSFQLLCGFYLRKQIQNKDAAQKTGHQQLLQNIQINGKRPYIINKSLSKAKIIDNSSIKENFTKQKILTDFVAQKDDKLKRCTYRTISQNI